MPPEIFGDVLDPSIVEDAALATLKLWLPDHIAHQERRAGVPARTWPVPTEFPLLSEIDVESHQRLPAVFLVSPGTQGEHEKLTGGAYRVNYRLEVAVLVADRTEPDVRRQAGHYLAAIIGALVQNRTLGGAVEKCTWVGPNDHAIASVPVGREQRAIYGTAFLVTVRDVVNQDLGPQEPSEDPYEPDGPPLPATSAVITVTPQEIP